MFDCLFGINKTITHNCLSYVVGHRCKAIAIPNSSDDQWIVNYVKMLMQFYILILPLKNSFHR